MVKKEYEQEANVTQLQPSWELAGLKYLASFLLAKLPFSKLPQDQVDSRRLLIKIAYVYNQVF